MVCGHFCVMYNVCVVLRTPLISKFLMFFSNDHADYHPAKAALAWPHTCTYVPMLIIINTCKRQSTFLGHPACPQISIKLKLPVLSFAAT